MKLSVLVFALVALAAVHLPGVSAIWVRTYDGSTCSSPVANIGNVPSGTSTPAPDGSTSYVVTCTADNNGAYSQVALLRCDQSRTCGGTDDPQTINLQQGVNGDVGVYNGSTCLTASTNAGVAQSFRIYCDEASATSNAAIQQSKLIKQTVYADAACSASTNGAAITTYSDPLGECSVDTDGTAQVAYLASGALVEWDFSGSACTQNTAVSVNRAPLGQCVGRYVSVSGSSVSVYSIYTAPTASLPSTASAPGWAATFPPANSAVRYSCPNVDCTQAGCYASGATILGRCQANAGLATASYCLSTGHLGLAGWTAASTASCSGSASYVVAQFTGAGSCRLGSYVSCPGATSGAPSVPSALRMRGFIDPYCTNAQENVVTQFKAGACVSGGTAAFSASTDPTPVPQVTTYSGSNTAQAFCGSTATAGQTSTYSGDCTVPSTVSASAFIPGATDATTGAQIVGSYKWLLAQPLESNGYIKAAASPSADPVVNGAALPSGGDPDANGQGRGNAAVSAAGRQASAGLALMLAVVAAALAQIKA